MMQPIGTDLLSAGFHVVLFVVIFVVTYLTGLWIFRRK
jgi:ABC-type transport system involved in multi-copper enzyme maturation permease subunit